MLKLLSSNLWSEIETLATNAKRKQVAVAYVSEELHIKFKTGDTLITDASDEKIASGSTSKRLITDAFRRKVKLYSLQNLHSKIFIFDDVLIVGSTNISSSSRNRLYEAGIVTDDIQLVSSAQKLLEKYKKHAEKVNSSFIQKIKAIEIMDKSEISTVVKASKPSLVDLLQSNNYLLDDYVVIFHESGATLTNRKIKEYAKKKGVKLPPPQKWAWYEYDFDRDADRTFKQFYEKSEMKTIGLEITHNDKKIEKFVDVDTDIQVFVNKMKINQLIVNNFIVDKRPPFKFDKRRLLKKLNEMLMENRLSGEKLFDKTGWILSAKEFAKIMGIK